MTYRSYTTGCATCSELTTRKYAREHEGRCKQCVTGLASGKLCPDCRVNRLTSYQVRHHYHCDACTRDADPQGYINEVMGYDNYEPGF